MVRWIDGDTVVTRAGTVRLIGVDTPEVVQVGYTTAKNSAARWAPVGHMVRLGNPVSVDNRDRYGRALRYVVSARGIDISRAEIRIGAKARYDGRDGYDWHPRQKGLPLGGRPPPRLPPSYDPAPSPLPPLGGRR